MDIRADHVRMKQLGTKILEEKYKEYTDELRQIFEEIETLKTKWVGIDQTSFIQNIVSKKASLENLGKTMGGYGAFLIESSGYIAKAQNDIADAASGL